MINDKNTGEVAHSVEQSGASISKSAEAIEQASARGTYTLQHIAPYEHLREQYIELRDEAEALVSSAKKGVLAQALLYVRLGCKSYKNVVADIQVKMDGMTYVKDEDVFCNLVTTVGKNDTLDKYLAGSAYTAAFYLGLISLTSYSAVAVGDTMASHAGWLEAGVANTPTYSQSTRPAAAWSSASSGSKALSSALAFSITGTGTVKGCFLTTVSTKDGTTGILYSAGLFTGGDRAVVNGDTLNVSYTASQ